MSRRIVRRSNVTKYRPITLLDNQLIGEVNLSDITTYWKPFRMTESDVIEYINFEFPGICKRKGDIQNISDGLEKELRERYKLTFKDDFDTEDYDDIDPIDGTIDFLRSCFKDEINDEVKTMIAKEIVFERTIGRRKLITTTVAKGVKIRYVITLVIVMTIISVISFLIGYLLVRAELKYLSNMLSNPDNNVMISGINKNLQLPVVGNIDITGAVETIVNFINNAFNALENYATVGIVILVFIMVSSTMIFMKQYYFIVKWLSRLFRR